MSKQISLSQGQFAIVDDEDYEAVSCYKWQAKRDKHTWYAVRTYNFKKIQMHAQIMRTPVGRKTDHADGNGLNNRRENLRVCDSNQNGANRRLNSTSVSGFKGVSFDKDRGKWSARIKVNGKEMHLKQCATPE